MENATSATTQKRLPKVRRSDEPTDGGASSGGSGPGPPPMGAGASRGVSVDDSGCGQLQGFALGAAIAIDGASEAAVGPPQ